MAPIAIILSCAIGFLTGVVQFTFFDASLWQAFVTYISLSIALSMVALATALISDRQRVQGEEAHAATLEDWQDWQTEEEMEAARLQRQSHGAAKDFANARKSA